MSLFFMHPVVLLPAAIAIAVGAVSAVIQRWVVKR